eukprot:2156349-Amphidinium_carterae.1
MLACLDGCSTACAPVPTSQRRFLDEVCLRQAENPGQNASASYPSLSCYTLCADLLDSGFLLSGGCAHLLLSSLPVLPCASQDGFADDDEHA